MRSLSCLKYILCYATLVVMLVLVCSCADENEFAINEGEVPSAVLRLTTRSTVSRSDAHYDDDSYAEANGSLQEEKINRVNLFFFESAETTDAAFYTCELQANATTIADVTVKIPIDKINKFKDGKAYVYALVNIPSDIKLGDMLPGNKAATMENLTQLWVKAEAFVKKGIPGDFVMRGGDVVTLDNSGEETKVTGWISLERLASKIRLFAGIEQTIYLDDKGKTINREEGETIEEWQRRAKNAAAEIWDSEPYHINSDGTRESDVNLYIYNAATRGRIDGFLPDKKDSGKREMLGLGNVDRKDESKDAARIVDTGISLGDYRKKQDSEEYADISRDVYPYTHGAAYYSYPNDWDTSNLYEENQTYVILSLPWRRKDKDDGSGEIYQTCYYQIPINKLVGKENGKQKDRLDPNTYYRIKIHLGMLGSKDLGEPLEVEASYEAVEWSNASVDVNLKGRRYLVVNQKEWVMNNTSTLQIPFSSSHKTKIVSCYVNYFRYNDVWGKADDTRGEPVLEEFNLWLKAADDDEKLIDGRNAEEGLISASFERQLSYNSQTERTKDEYGDSWGDWWVRYREYTVTKTYEILQYEKEDLYYKKKYFYDDVENTFLYYLGHEHPKTFQEKYISNDVTINPNAEKMKPEEKEAWKQYNQKYGDINAVYTCTIDNDKGVINFNHPLVQWEDVRTTRDVRTDKDPDVIEVESNFYEHTTTTTKVVRKIKSSELQYYVPLLNPRTGYLWDEFSRCEIVIKIRHEDWDENDDLYEETIHITQYPAMYVEVSHNYGGVYKDLNNRGNEYILINGYTTENPNNNKWGTATEWYEVTGLVTYFGLVNNNPNMYVIHTTQFSEENEAMYELGDPRTLFYNNNLDDNSIKDVTKPHDRPTSNNWSSSRPKETGRYQEWQYDNYNITIADGEKITPNGTDKKLAFYYPTDETTGAGSKENFIAPSFRIASSLGKVSLVYASNYGDSWPKLNDYSRTDARRRCASYQEAGRPAGRWRVPTAAEIKYLVQLSADERIPHLFGLQDYPEMYIPYWSSTGIVCVKVEGAEVKMMNITELETPPAVRCVYDEWYWTQIDKQIDYEPKPKDKTFRWGDRPKDNTQTQSLIKRMIYQK